MKKKYITETYLRGVNDYDIKIIKDEKLNCYTSVKRINSIDKRYIYTNSKEAICLLDKGYYIVEYLPIDKHYTIRVFMNDKKEVLQYYIDITKENGIENNIPFYYDLYLDITIDVLLNNDITIWDQDELDKAMQTNDISEDDYTMAHNTIRCLLDQIKSEENKYINKNHKDTIDELMFAV